MTAPTVDLDALHRAVRFLRIFAAHPTQARRDRVMHLLSNLRREIELSFNGNTTMLLCYARIMQAIDTERHGHLRLDSKWRLGLRMLHRYAAERPTMGAVPAML